MRKLLSLMTVIACMMFAMPGCDDGGGSIVEDAEQSALEEYDALLEADQKSLGSEPPADLTQ